MSIPKIAVVTGPTATGKTRLAIELAKAFDGEIVSADSMQIYRSMDIATAKATPQERAQAPHHMIDIADPGEGYSVSRYVEQASRVCDDILSRGKLPIVAGGTGLYIDSLISGREFADKEDEGLRKELEAQFDAKGREAMLKTLAEFDPERAEKLISADKRRIVRAIEIYRLTGVTATEHDAISRRMPPRYDAARIILSFEDRAELYARINERVDAMVEDGLFAEVEGLLNSGVPPQSTAMQAIGYKEAALALSGEISRDQAIELIKLGSRRYAKRQLTWFRQSPDALWIKWDSTPDFTKAVLLSTDFLHSRGIS